MSLGKPNYYFYDGFIFENKFNPTKEDNGIITVNYLLSSKCQLNCGYCIAKDIMEKYPMPSLEQIDSAVDTILELDPLVTVLIGGEPLLSPYLKHVIERLYGHTHIMLDTNGLLLPNSDLEFFRKYKVTIRISVDNVGEKNCITRPNKLNQPYEIGDVLKYMDEKGYPFVISTVISNYNAEELFLMAGIYSLYQGVLGWRLQNIIPCHNIDLSPYINDPKTGLPTDFKENEIFALEMAKYIGERRWTDKPFFSIQICEYEHNHSTIMILPDSSIAVSNKSSNTREILTLEELRKKINDDNHETRYVLK